MSARYAVIGHPVAHSLSPALFGWLFEQTGVEATYEKLDVAPDEVAVFLQNARGSGLRGLSVTVPHKEAVLPLLDEVEPTAARIGAVNCITVAGDKLIGANTDAYGVVMALAAQGFGPQSQEVLILGAGGAARAAAFAAAEHGAERVHITNRTRARADELAAALGPKASAHEWSAAALQPLMERVTVIIQATTVGLDNPTADPLPAGLSLTPEHVVLDMVYRPLRTALLRRAEEAGAATVDGLWMLVEQALAAWERWRGEPAPHALARPLHAHLVSRVAGAGSEESLLVARAGINAIDREVIRLLGARFELARGIGLLKASLGEPVVRPEREQSLRALHRRWSEEARLDPELTRRIYDPILDASRALQEALKKDAVPSRGAAGEEE